MLTILAKKKWFTYANHGNHAEEITVPLGLFTGGSVLTYVAASGTTNNVNPGGAWPSASIGRLVVDTTAGPAIFTGLVAALQDGMGILLTVKGGNPLALDNLNAGSSAANQFSNAVDLTLFSGQNVMLVYSVGAIAKWEVT